MRPSAREVGGWPGAPVSGSRNPEAEPPESEAGPANDKELSERGESNGAPAAICHRRKQEVRRFIQKDEGERVKESEQRC